MYEVFLFNNSERYKTLKVGVFWFGRFTGRLFFFF